MKSARGFNEAAELLSSIALSSPQEPRTVFDFSPVDVLLLAGQAHEKVGNLSQAASSFHNAASWYATAAQEQWEVVSQYTVPWLLNGCMLSCACAVVSGDRVALVPSNTGQDNSQQFKFGLAYYNLARMLGLQNLWAEAL